MTRAYAMRELLNHGALTRNEIVEITGWTADKVRYTLSHLAETDQIQKKGRQWHLK
jgi:transcription initiation factor IIE alpha subunit